MTAIIFGINGQDGYYLNEVCKANGIGVIGVSRSENEWVKGNIGGYDFVSSLIKKVQPQFLFHLAANSTTRHDALFENHETISTGTLNVLEAVKQFAPQCKVFITGSGVQFKNIGKPIKETDEFEASSPYAVARIQSVYAARYYRSLGVKTYVGYLFHHESPLRKGGHLSKFIAESVKKIAIGELKEIEIGNTTVMKEWGYAGDIAKGIFELVKQDSIFEATIGTGKSYSISAWLELCFSNAGLNWKEFVVENSATFKPEYHHLVSDPTTMHTIGWQAETSIEEMAKLMMS